MRLRTGGKGAFWGCRGYPACKYKQSDDGGKPGVRPDDVQGRAPRRHAPSPSPSPGTTAPKASAVVANAAEPCPRCGEGELIGRVLKDSGWRFLGCTGFPACRHFQ